LNKIRFRNINKEVKEALAERFAAYNPLIELWNTTFLVLLRKEARLLNQIVLDSIPTNSDSFVSLADDF
jgi:16S rRNA G527 N7-methylase RsmG